MNITRRQALKTGVLALAGGLFFPKSAKAIDKDEVILNPFVRPNLHRDDYWGSVDWDELRDKQDRLEYREEVLADDKTDEIPYVDGEWISGNFSTQLHLNTHGFVKFDESHDDISEKFDITKLGYYNIPLYRMSIISPGWNHGANAILFGDENKGDPKIWDNWLKIEPQKDWIVDIGSQSIPENCDEININRIYAFSSFGLGTLPLLKFKITNKIPELTYSSPNLVLERPKPVYVAENPIQFSLSQNYPNPFNASTSIEYSLDEPGKVLLDIFNTNGQHLDTLVNEHQLAGKHRITWNANNYSSGTYFYNIRSGDKVESKKMMLVK